jgi:uncharacterized membrane protein YfhO
MIYPADPRQERVEVVSFNDQELVLQARLDKSGLVVTSEVFYPGWQAVDERGIHLPLLRANHAFRGVWLPRGTHQVTMTYVPPSFRLGLWCSITTGIIAGILVCKLGIKNKPW